MSWHLAPSLVEFRRWVFSTWPKHDTSRDGTVGDAAHAARVSDHNPNVRGSVNAIDIQENNVHMPTIIVAAMMHPSTHYVIYERIEYSAKDLFKPTTYDGINHHDDHCHVSIWQTVKAEQSKNAWGITSWPTLINGSIGRAVSELQGYLNVYGAELNVDGHFGDSTDAAVKAYQHRFNVVGGADGVVGIHTRHSLQTNPVHRH